MIGEHEGMRTGFDFHGAGSIWDISMTVNIALKTFVL